MTIGQLAYHLATVPGSVLRAAGINPAPAPDFANSPQPASRQEVLALFDENVATVRELLPKFDNEAMNETWRLVAGGHEVFAQPHDEFLRDTMLSHWYQHRGQLSVYLRIRNIPVPATWGPSADEPPRPRQGRRTER